VRLHDQDAAALPRHKPLGGGCFNISVIIKRYAKFCKALAENPDQLLDQLMTKGPPTLE